MTSLIMTSQMPEEQAFHVLVKIMFDYKMRDLFKNGFEDLHLKFFQLERAIDVSLMLLRYSWLLGSW